MAELDAGFMENEMFQSEFKTVSDDQKATILSGKDKKSTQKVTKGAVDKLKKYLHAKKLPEFDAVPDDQWPEVLYNFYMEVKPKKEEDYAVQTLKCLCAGLNRHFKAEKGINIIKDPGFMRPNEMFRGVIVHSKQVGKGIKKSYPKISEADLKRIGAYFNHDYMNHPNPCMLQQNVIFFIIYFFCWQGRENLYEMKIDTFKLFTKPDGTQYVYQAIDKVDKNHGPDDATPSNDGRIHKPLNNGNCN